MSAEVRSKAWMAGTSPAMMGWIDQSGCKRAVDRLALAALAFGMAIGCLGTIALLGGWPLL
jgi:hypothetical protein